MNVNSSTVAAAAFGATGRASGGHGLSRQTTDAVAAELGMSSDDLQKALAGGESMTDLAQKAGVGKDALVQTIAATLPATGKDGAAIDTTQLATRLADRVRGQRPENPPAPSSPSTSGSALGQGIDALSSALGISSDDLMQRLTDGSGITDLLAARPDLAAQLTASGAKGALVDGYA